MQTNCVKPHNNNVSVKHARLEFPSASEMGESCTVLVHIINFRKKLFLEGRRISKYNNQHCIVNSFSEERKCFKYLLVRNNFIWNISYMKILQNTVHRHE